MVLFGKNRFPCIMYPKIYPHLPIMIEQCCVENTFSDFEIFFSFHRNLHFHYILGIMEMYFEEPTFLE